MSTSNYKICLQLKLKVFTERYIFFFSVICFNSDIRFWAASAVSKISDPEVLDTLTYFMIKKIEDLFKSKLRYHSNSQLQRALRACLQNLLFILLKSRNVKIKSIAMWCIEFLGKIPHQPFERICLEWYISQYFYLQVCIISVFAIT